MMQTFRVTWVDGVTLDVKAENGTQAKELGRRERRLTKSQMQIARVEPIADEPPAEPPAEDRPRW
jgi:hypothetical protein